MLFIKSFRTLLFGSLLVGLAVPLVFSASPTPSKAAKPAAKSSQAKKVVSAPEARKLVVYYFHGNARCFTCRKFETLTKDVMETRFADDVKKGRMDYQVVNVDDSGNGHFVNDYGLYSKSVVLSDTKDGKQVRWKNLDKIWEKVRDENAYRQYIQDEITSFLKEG